MSYRADLMQFFESESTNYSFEYDIELIVRRNFLTYIKKTGKKESNDLYHSFLCNEITTELRKGSDRYGDLEQEWSLLTYYYGIESKRAKETQPYNPFRLWVLLDFILQLKA